MKSKPYLSVIIPCRNDDFEGDVIGRLQMTINSLIWQAKQYNLRAELIIVDWNPPPDRPLLKEAIFLPDDLGLFVVRFIVVPPSIHKKYKCSEKINIVSTAAKNVGIKRAQGEFILPTNSDILFSNELIHFLSLERLEKNRFYRAFRYDIHRDVLNCASLKERLDFCKKNIVEVYPKTSVSPHGLAEHPTLQTSWGSDFLLFPREYWHLLHGYPELNNLGLGADWLLCYMAYLAGLKEEILEDSMRVYHIDHYKHQKRREALSKGVYHFLKNRVYNRLNYNSRLRILMKRINRFKNRALHFFVNTFYNQFGSFFQRISKPESLDFNKQYLYWEFHKVLVKMLKGKRSYVYNDDNWGLPNENFKEFVISSDKKGQKNYHESDK